jgi:putative membrane protein
MVMTKGLLSIFLFGLLAVGCSSSNSRASSADTGSKPSAGEKPSSAGSSRATSSSSTSSNPDREFIDEAAKGNRAEIELGKMVASKATDPHVKQFAQMMVADHTKELNELQKVAASKNITLPEGIPDDAQALKTKLRSASGKDLEKDYMDGMVQYHKKNVQEFQEATQKLEDNEVKQWATNTLPVLQKHLQRAQQIDSRLSGGKAQTGR